MQQYVGVILNFFRDSAESFKNYNESNITELVFKEEPAAKEEEKVEEPKK